MMNIILKKTFSAIVGVLCGVSITTLFTFLFASIFYIGISIGEGKFAEFTVCRHVAGVMFILTGLFGALAGFITGLFWDETID